MFLRLLFFCVFCNFSIFLLAAEPQTPSQAKPSTRFLLVLGNQVLKGMVTEEGSQFRVTSDFGSMLLPQTNVLVIGDSMQALYEYRRNHIDHASYSHWLELADWCVSQSLKAEAKAAYEKASQLAPHDSLKQHISQKMAQTAKKDAEKEDVPSPKPDARWAAEVPITIRNQFAQKVHLALTDRCASSQCHGSQGTTAFRLHVPRMEGATVTMQTNLQAVLPYVDFENPTASPILHAMVTGHGGKKAVYDVEDNQYSNILSWVQMVVKEMPPHLKTKIASAANEQRGKTPLSVPPNSESKTSESSVATTVPESFLPKNVPSVAPVSALPVVSAPALPNSYQATSLNLPQSKAAEDPFDPDSFNLRHHGR